MSARKRSHRGCRDYEREWNGFCIDKNLEDNWLLRLNELKCLRPISICEGHSDQKAGSSRTFPHIKLRLLDPLLPGIAGHWDQLKRILPDELKRLFHDGNTYLELELKCRFRRIQERFPYRENLTVRIHGRQARTSQEMEAATYEWFEKTVSRVEELDNVIAVQIGATD